MPGKEEAIQEIRVGLRGGGGGDARVDRLTELLIESGIDPRGIDVVVVYSFEGITEFDAERLRESVLTDPVTQVSSLNSPLFFGEGDARVRIGLKPQVINPWEASLFRVARDFNIQPIAVATSTEYVIHALGAGGALESVGTALVNQVETVLPDRRETLVFEARPRPVETIAITSLSDGEWETLSRARSLFLLGQEMGVISEYFRGLHREPTDIELETLAQTWSEHNGHKTFKARLIDDETGRQKAPLIQRIKETSQKYFERVGVISAFSDNAGGIRLYDGWAIVGKWETHNSPVAIEPFGGAATKNGGVFRDIAGTGLGGTSLAAFMINNVAPLNTSEADVPPGCLHPRYIFKENSRGERSYGNPMGIPTHAVDIHVHPDFAAKPTSMGGVIGLIPESACVKEDPRPGDLLVTVGGKTGKDGIHGATFSSGEMTSTTLVTHATAVQLGNPIEEKRMFDALIDARDRGLLVTITDCGGGGYSSAVGEMAEHIGVVVQLSDVPLKYKGLSPWEIWLSESQERMIVAVDPVHWEEFERICQTYEVPVGIIGTFTGDRRLTLRYEDRVVGELSMDFLHHGLPQREMHMKKPDRQEVHDLPAEPHDYVDAYERVLGHMNVASVEPMLRQYDTTVQGRTVLHPFGGVYHDGPNDASVVAPLYGKPYGVVTAGGSNPVLVRADPYWGSVWAVAKAMSNFVAVGGNPREAALIDNFVWPYPDAESLHDLDQSVSALCDMMNVLELPCVSGKDSLSSTYRYPDGKILNIPPVLHVSAFGRIPDVFRTVTSDIKSPGSTLVLVGAPDVDSLGGSVYFDTQGVANPAVPRVGFEKLPKTFSVLHDVIRTGRVLSCHDVAEGGLAATVAQMCFGGDCGAQIVIDGLGSRMDLALFNETAGCFVVEVKDDGEAEELFSGVRHMVLGKTVKNKRISVHYQGASFDADLYRLKKAWQTPMKEIYP